MDRLTAVRVFVEVADRGSLTGAAEHLDMSAAMVSRYLAAVEGWLGARLLHRTTRKLSLTDAGLPRCPRAGNCWTSRKTPNTWPPSAAASPRACCA